MLLLEASGETKVTQLDMSIFISEPDKSKIRYKDSKMCEASAHENIIGLYITVSV